MSKSMKKEQFSVAFLILAILAGNSLFTAGARPIRNRESRPSMPETKAERDNRMKWWREARFGMFIHWGLYAVPAGEYNGQRSDRNGRTSQDLNMRSSRHGLQPKNLTQLNG